MSWRSSYASAPGRPNNSVMLTFIFCAVAMMSVTVTRLRAEPSTWSDLKPLRSPSVRRVAKILYLPRNTSGRRITGSSFVKI